MSFRVAHSPWLHSSVLHERGWRRDEAQSPAGALSLKCMFGARRMMKRASGRYRVDDGRCLLLNHGRRYTVTIDSPQPLESFCIFFALGWKRVRFHSERTP
jgi:hypothetical protein